jgi:hypothetical protein
MRKMTISLKNLKQFGINLVDIFPYFGFIIFIIICNTILLWIAESLVPFAFSYDTPPSLLEVFLSEVKFVTSLRII